MIKLFQTLFLFLLLSFLLNSFFLIPVYASSPLLNHTYTYDNVGNIKKISDNLDGSKTLSYTYDDIYRLKSVDGAYTASYDYDQDGNIKTKIEGESNISEGYSPGTTSTHAPRTVNGYSLLYDDNGNLIEDNYSNLKITYDYDNRPIQITNNKEHVTSKYYYDGEGKRVKKEIYSIDPNNPSNPPTLKSTTYYVNQYYEKEVPVGQQVKVRKLYQGVAYRENSDLKYTTTDHLSSTTLTTSTQGQKIAQYAYYPYGSPNLQLTTQNSQLPPNSWIGQKLDNETNLYFLNARYYNPLYARFIQSDSVNDPSVKGNNYIYGDNNPIINSDPSGNCITQICDPGGSGSGDGSSSQSGFTMDEAGKQYINGVPYEQWCASDYACSVGQMGTQFTNGMWDFLNAPYYLRKGDYGSFALSLVGLIPGGQSGIITAKGAGSGFLGWLKGAASGVQSIDLGGYGRNGFKSLQKLADPALYESQTIKMLSSQVERMRATSNYQISRLNATAHVVSKMFPYNNAMRPAGSLADQAGTVTQLFKSGCSGVCRHQAPLVTATLVDQGITDAVNVVYRLAEGGAHMTTWVPSRNAFVDASFGVLKNQFPGGPIIRSSAIIWDRQLREWVSMFK